MPSVGSPSDRANPTNTPQTPTAEPLAPAAIPLPEVATRSQELQQSLRTIGNSLPAPDELAEMDAAIRERAPILDTKQKEADALLSGTPSSIELREQENYWRGIQAYSNSERKQLLDWAKSAQKAVNQLDAQQPQWAATLDANRNVNELGPTLELLRGNVNDIRKLRAQAAAQLQQVVNMQIQSSAQDQVVADMLSQLTQARAALKTRLFRRDSLPLWQFAARRAGNESVRLYGSAGGRWIAISSFANEHRTALIAIAILLIVSLGLAHHLYRITASTVPLDDSQALVLRVVRHWFALGMLPPLICAYLLATSAPLTLIGLFILISFIPILQLLPPLLDRRSQLMLYCLTGVYAFNAALGWMSLSPIVKRELLFAGNALVLILFAWIALAQHHKPIGEDRQHKWYIWLGIRAAVAGLGASLLANLFGYLKLAQFLAVASFYSTFIGLTVATAYHVFTLLLRAGLETPQAERFAAVRLHRTLLARWLPRLLLWAGLLLWITATLDLLGVREAVWSAIQTVLNFHIVSGATTIAFGSVLGFFFMLSLGYAIASAIRFLLREEILTRFHLARGLPELIASTIYYILLLLVFFFAVNAGGVELNRFTLLTGALGVGFGFGLQNIINNFVSGLILQFERPIHINDVLDVDGYSGESHPYRYSLQHAPDLPRR